MRWQRVLRLDDAADDRRVALAVRERQRGGAQRDAGRREERRRLSLPSNIAATPEPPTLRALPARTARLTAAPVCYRGMPADVEQPAYPQAIGGIGRYADGKWRPGADRSPLPPDALIR